MTTGDSALRVGLAWNSEPRRVTESEFALLHDITWAVTDVHTSLPFARALGLRERNLSGSLIVPVAIATADSGMARGENGAPEIRGVRMTGLTRASFKSAVYPEDVIVVRSEIVALGDVENGRRAMTLRESVLNQEGLLVAEFDREVSVDWPADAPSLASD